MAMLPFCGYNMGDYFQHWICHAQAHQISAAHFPRELVPQRRHRQFLWPGFGENMRVLKWIVDRCNGQANANETPLGWVPGADSFDLTGLKDYTPEKFEQAQTINYEDWRRELLQQDELFMKLYSHLPKELIFQRELLVARL